MSQIKKIREFNHLETVKYLIDELNEKVKGFVQYSKNDYGTYNLYNHSKQIAVNLDIDDMELLLNYLIRWEETK